MTTLRLLEEPYSSSATKMHLQWSQRRRVPRSATQPIVYSESGLRQKLLPVARKTAPWRLGTSLRPQPTFRAYGSHKRSWPRLEDRKSRLVSGQADYSQYIHFQSCPGGVASIRRIDSDIARTAQIDIEIPCGHMVDSCHVARRRQEHGWRQGGLGRESW